MVTFISSRLNKELDTEVKPVGTGALIEERHGHLWGGVPRDEVAEQARRRGTRHGRLRGRPSAEARGEAGGRPAQRLPQVCVARLWSSGPGARRRGSLKPYLKENIKRERSSRKAFDPRSRRVTVTVI